MLKELFGAVQPGTTTLQDLKQMQGCLKKGIAFFPELQTLHEQIVDMATKQQCTSFIQGLEEAVDAITNLAPGNVTEADVETLKSAWEAGQGAVSELHAEASTKELLTDSIYSMLDVARAMSESSGTQVATLLDIVSEVGKDGSLSLSLKLSLPSSCREAVSSGLSESFMT